MKNRRGAAWTLDAEAWTPKNAAGKVTERITSWGFKPPDALHPVVIALATTAITDGGRRISVHLSEQDGLVLVLVISHQAPATDDGDDVLPRLRELGVPSCGIETSPEGRQIWALLDLIPLAA